MLTLVLQVWLAASAAAAMAAPAEIICTSAAGGSHGSNAPHSQPTCGCDLLCQAGMAVPAALGPSTADALPIRFAARIEPLVEAPAPTREPRIEGRRQARAPPIPRQD